MSSTRFPLYRTILRIIIWDTLHIFTNISPATSLCKAGRSVHWYSLEKPSERYFLLCKFQETPNVVYHQHNPIQYQRQNTQSLNITLKFHCLIVLPILKAHATILYRWLCLTFLDNHLLSRVSWHHQMGAGNSHTKKSCIGHATSTQNVNACWGKLCNQNNIYGYRYFGIYIYMYIFVIYIYTSWFVWTQQTWRNIYDTVYQNNLNHSGKFNTLLHLLERHQTRAFRWNTQGFFAGASCTMVNDFPRKKTL